MKTEFAWMPYQFMPPANKGDIWCKNMHEGMAQGAQLLSFTIQKETAQWRRENTLLIIIYGDWI